MTDSNSDVNSDISTDVNTDVTVVVRTPTGFRPLDVDSIDPDKIEEAIEARFDNGGNYEYGVYSPLGECSITEPTYNSEDVDNTADEILADIGGIVADRDEFHDFSRHSSISRKYMASYFGTNVRYSVYDTDFSVGIDISEFDDVPINTFDEDAEEHILSLFEEFGDEATYLGFQSSYANRGRRNPYVRVYGRVSRDTQTDQALRSITDLDCIETVIWTTDNISPIPIYTNESSLGEDETPFDAVDTIAVFSNPIIDGEDTDLLDPGSDIPSQDLETLMEHIDEFPDFGGVEVVCFGVVLYGYHSTQYYYAGLSTDRYKH